MGPGRGLSRPSLVPAALAALIAAVAVAGFFVTRSLADDRGETARALAAAEAAAIDARLSSDAAVLSSAGSALADIAARVDIARFADRREIAVAVAARAPTGAVTLSDVVWADGDASALEAIDLATVPEWRLALELARDSGGTVASAAGLPGRGWTVLQARPLYGGAVPPADVGDRRHQLEGYLVLLEPVSSLVKSDSGGGLRLLQNSQAIAARDTGEGGDTATANANGGRWTVEASAQPSTTSLPYTMLVIGLLLAAIVAVATAVRERSSRALAATAVSRANELGLVARMGALVQQSLDVADLLPLFVIEISDELALDGSSVSLTSSSGALVRAFSLGTGSGGGETAAVDLSMLPTPAASIPPGGSVTVPLQRGARIIGRLSANAPVGLTASQVETLRSACDLLAAALGNARSLQEEQELVARLRELDRLKATFLGSVSHELRTMVVAIEGFAELLATQSARFDETRKSDFIERIRRNSRSLGVLVEDLLDFARLESAGMTVSVTRVNLSELVPIVIDQMSSILGPRPLKVEIAPGVIALADPVAVERILVNLLSNAAKYSPPDAEVSVVVDTADDTAELLVSDRGPGIAAAERERVFELFYRVDNAAARATRGVGIGLALARELAELLHGTIAAEEAPGGGARFRLRLPLADRDDATTPHDSGTQLIHVRSSADVEAS